MPVPAPKFADTKNSVRLAWTAEMRTAFESATSMPDLHASLIGLMRRYFGVLCYTEITTGGLTSGEYRVTRAWGESGIERVPNRSPWRFDGVPIRSGGVIAEVLAHAQPALVPEFSFPPDDPVFAQLGTYHSMAACPGAMRNRENWVFILDPHPGKFEITALEDLALRVLLTGSALENLSIADELRAAYQRLEKATEFMRGEVSRIAAIQKCLLPPPEPTVPGLDVSAWSETYDQAGGDLYDYTEGPDGRWACMVADASGHGPSAAVVAAILNTILHTFPQIRDPQTDSGNASLVELPTVLTFANEQLAAKRIERSFVTAFLGAWDPVTKILSYARAAHNPPLLYRRADGSMIELSAASGLPLGLFSQATYNESTVQLSPGDVVVMFSDGIVEAESAAGEQFGIGRLRSITASAAAGPAREIVAAIRSAVREHENGGRPDDDQTLFVVRVV